MYTIPSFVWSVAAGIVANFICKWLDVLFMRTMHTSFVRTFYYMHPYQNVKRHMPFTPNVRN